MIPPRSNGFWNEKIAHLLTRTSTPETAASAETKNRVLYANIAVEPNTRAHRDDDTLYEITRANYISRSTLETNTLAVCEVTVTI